MASFARTVALGGLVGAFAALRPASPVSAQDLPGAETDRWVTVTEAAAGTDLAAKDRAVAAALRKAVQQACGVFLHSQEKVQNYKLVYSKIFESTAGYVVSHKVERTWVQEGLTHVRVRAKVSKRALRAGS